MPVLASDGRAASWRRGRVARRPLAGEVDRDESPGRNAGELVLARLRRANEERQLLLLAGSSDSASAPHEWPRLPRARASSPRRELAGGRRGDRPPCGGLWLGLAVEE